MFFFIPLFSTGALPSRTLRDVIEDLRERKRQRHRAAMAAAPTNEYDVDGESSESDSEDTDVDESDDVAADEALAILTKRRSQAQRTSFDAVVDFFSTHPQSGEYLKSALYCLIIAMRLFFLRRR